MPYFKDTKQMYRCLGTLFERAARDPVMGQKIADAKLVVRFVYKEPDGQITIDSAVPFSDSYGYFLIEYGESKRVAGVTMSMKADIGHQFWFGKINLLTAVNRRQIVPQGPMTTIFKLLPVIVPTFKMYPKVLFDLGETELILA